MDWIELHREIPYSLEFVDKEDDFLSDFADDDWLPPPVKAPPLLEAGFSCALSCNNDISKYAKSICICRVKCVLILFGKTRNGPLPEVTEEAKLTAKRMATLVYGLDKTDLVGKAGGLWAGSLGLTAVGLTRSTTRFVLMRFVLSQARRD